MTRPRAFRLSPGSQTDENGAALPSNPSAHIHIEEQPDPFVQPDADASESAIEQAQRRGVLSPRIGWGALFCSALAGLVSLSIGLWITQLVENLLQKSSSLGWIAIALATLALIATLVLVIKELMTLQRQRHIAFLHKGFHDDRLSDNGPEARKHLKQLLELYADRPPMQQARQQIVQVLHEIIDARDLIDIAERTLIVPLDKQAMRCIANAAKAVSMVTTLSPGAIVDVLFVAGQTLYLIRKIAEIYGGRPGFWGLLRLIRSIGAHLILTGGMALGDQVLQQVLGHGLAAKLSARLGEGVFNGLLTTRIGLSALAVCRPMPFCVEAAPTIKDLAFEVFSK